jgi:hypothetical protein
VKEIRDKNNDTKHVNRVGLIHPVWPGLIIRTGHAKRWGDNIRSGAREKRSAVKSLSVYQAKIWINLKMKVSVVISCYNEKDTIEKIVEAVGNFSLNFWR